MKLMKPSFKHVLLAAVCLASWASGCATPPPVATVCSAIGCMNGKSPCGKAACMVPHSGGPAVCEYAPKLTGVCRCFPGDMRACTTAASTPGITTCVSDAPGTDTWWGTCTATP